MADEVDLFQLHIGLLNSSHAPKKLREKARDFVRQLYDPVLKKHGLEEYREPGDPLSQLTWRYPAALERKRVVLGTHGKSLSWWSYFNADDWHCSGQGYTPEQLDLHLTQWPMIKELTPMAWACCYRRWGTRVLAGDNDIKYHHPLDLEPEDIAEAKRLFREFADVSLTTQQFTHRYIRAVNATQTFPKPELAEALAQMHALLREHGWEQEEAQGLWRHEKFRSDDPLVGDPITFETTMNEEETVWREVEDEAGATDKSTSVADLEKRLKEFAKTATHA
jgi:hypothetical protein